MQKVAQRPDRRVARTRQVLQHAFLEVAREKGFDEITVLDVAERANVNRGTFYTHFADKYALFETIVRDDLRQLFRHQLPAQAEWNLPTLQSIIQIMLDYFKHLEGQCRPPDSIAPLMERAARAELNMVVLSWLRQQHSAKGTLVSAEAAARVMSWAIFGSAMQAGQERSQQTSAEQAHEIMQVIMGGLGQFTRPNTAPPTS